MGVAGGALCARRCAQMRARALQGQSWGSLVAWCEICSPRTAFFWSENVSVALVIGPVVVSSFKDASEAATRREPRVKVMSWRRKASERPSPSP